MKKDERLEEIVAHVMLIEAILTNNLGLDSQKIDECLAHMRKVIKEKWR